MANARSKKMQGTIRRPPIAAVAAPPEVVDPRWLLKALGVVIATGLACAYVMVCALFYSQQWQFVLHPSRTVSTTPTAEGLAFEPVRFGVDNAGRPQLAGWWVPGDLKSDPTVLLLHGQDGSLGDTVGAIKALHDARLNVLAFDYRGYGQSGGAHPNEASMQVDASDAFRYLLQTRGIPAATVIVYGAGLGASLAVHLCAEQSAIAGAILQSADGDTLSRVEADPRARVVPVPMLFHNRFPLADALRTLHTPKLLLSYTKGAAPVDAARAADPKITAELPSGSPLSETTAAVRRFLGIYVAHPAPVLQPGR